ncbi:hypothetical protein N7457_002243 [Penicillium paradoxum]|uniref:uncharacterized protein n=1 Tax=Penicillium paradoxum TaxID=176176 RepID=UPI002546BC96|nr:uncharacterized protein N7457_002243 [Penicillium paradoxum]KAJ5787253.1 hypothetical protein N7457_002243 [Penicillium paradoxum]
MDNCSLTMSLFKLPSELLIIVSSYLEYLSDLNALSQSHSRLYSLLKPRIYELLTEDTGQALARAAETGNGQCVRRLLDAGAPFPDSQSSIEDPMTLAAKNGHVDIVRIFLEYGRDPTPPIHDTGLKADHDDYMKRNPFAVAARGGHTSVVSLLMDHGAVKQSVNDDGDTLYDQTLSLAVMGMHIPIIKLLLAEGCNPNAMTSSRMVPLGYIATAPFTSASMEIINILVDAGAELVDEEALGTVPPFTIALSVGNVPFANFVIASQDNFDIQKFLELYKDVFLEQPAMASLPVRKTDMEKMLKLDADAGFKLLCGAAAGGQEELMKLLLTKKNDWTDENGLATLVDLAVEHGHIGILDLLFEEGVSLCARTKLKASNGSFSMDECCELGDYRPPPILLALEKGHDEIVNYLIDKGCAEALSESRGKGLLFNYALFLGKLEIIQKIFGTLTPSLQDIAFGDDGISIELAVFGGEAVFRFLLDHGVALNPDFAPHQKTLSIAAMLANAPILEMFFDAGLSLNMQSPDERPVDMPPVVCNKTRGSTLLAIAAQAKDRDSAEAAVDLLLERGVPIDQSLASLGRWTPLFSTIRGDVRRMIFLEQDSIRFRIKNALGTRSIKGLFQNENDNMDFELLATKLLLKKGADPFIWNEYRLCALTVAASRNKINVIKLLMETFDQRNISISLTGPRILAAISYGDDSVDDTDEDSPSDEWTLLPYRLEGPFDAIERALWQYYWPRVYPCPK